MLRPVRKLVGALLLGGLLALTGCGGSVRVVTKTVTAPSTAAVQTTPAKPSTPVAAATPTATPGAIETAAIAHTAEELASGIGDAALVTAALGAPAAAAGTTLSTPSTPQAKARASAPIRVIAKEATGQYAVAETNGTFKDPARIVLTLDASPPQNATVYWGIVCSELGGGVGQKKVQTTLKLPTSETLPLPAPSSSCIVSANGQLSGTGTLKISISG
jgi:hypothetical protein